MVSGARVESARVLWTRANFESFNTDPDDRYTTLQVTPSGYYVWKVSTKSGQDQEPFDVRSYHNVRRYRSAIDRSRSCGSVSDPNAVTLSATGCNLPKGCELAPLLVVR